MKPFDLNMEEVLENWEVFHAIREIIANALDEQLITGTQKIEIYQTDITGESVISAEVFRLITLHKMKIQRNTADKKVLSENLALV